MDRMGRITVALAVVAGLVCSLSAVAADDNKDKVPLPLELPPPAFEGTPKDAPPESKDVEPPSEKPRVVPLVPKGTVNVALDKPVTSSRDDTYSGTLEQLTDGIAEAYDGTCVELWTKLQWVQIDLGKSLPLQYLCLWHFHQQAVIVHDVVLQLSNDPEFIDGVTTIFNNDKDNSAGLGAGKDREYWETYEGKLVNCKLTKARYVRLYSRGSTFSDSLNRYTEVMVFAKP